MQQNRPELAVPEAIAHRAVVAQHVQSHAANHGQGFRRVVLAGVPLH